MLKSRWVSTFTVIGAILIVLGIVGLIMGPRFVYDPGQPVTGKEAWCYLVIGALMVLNGVMTPAPVETKSATTKAIVKPVVSETAAVSVDKAEETRTI
jgi:energy-converting hydrogenase Eha subunit E